VFEFEEEDEVRKRELMLKKLKQAKGRLVAAKNLINACIANIELITVFNIIKEIVNIEIQIILKKKVVTHSWSPTA